MKNVYAYDNKIKNTKLKKAIYHPVGLYAVRFWDGYTLYS